jgi:hypothetical protein
MNQPLEIKLVTKTEKVTRTTVDTIMFDPKLLEKWKSPPFQRPIKTNAKVVQLAEDLKGHGVLPGMITLGILKNETYILDGQHRKHAFLLSGEQVGYADVRIHHFTTMAEMATEFAMLNSQLVRMKPDDYLRALEESVPLLREIRKACPFVGYSYFRTSAESPILSMSATIRHWFNSAHEIPASSADMPTIEMAQTLTAEEVNNMVSFLRIAYAAFGREYEYSRLWSGLNLTICMWLYRRIVLTQYSSKTTQLTKEQWQKCLMSLSADSDYLDWLAGRRMGERDRSPCYGRIRRHMVARIEQEFAKKIQLPQPAWYTTSTPKFARDRGV